MILDPDFRPVLAGYDLDALEQMGNLVVGVRPDLTVGFRNRAWVRSAVRHGAAVLADPDQRLHVVEAAIPRLRPFYERLYRAAQDTGEAGEHEYLCPTPARYRRFRMRLLPLDGGVLVIHETMIDRPHGEPSQVPDPDLYRDEHGLIRQCAHCRATLRTDGSGSWDWVPEYLEGAQSDVSHGLCPTCVVWYYPDESAA